MIKTGKQQLLYVSLLLALVFAPGVHAQDITVSASLSETNIFQGESVTLNVVISGESLNSIERPTIPQVQGLRWLSGRTNQQQNFSYNNGRPSISYTYGYDFIAQAPGKYTFPALTLFVNNVEYTTKPVEFEILDPATLNNGNAARSPDIYVRLEPSNDKPVVGEQVIASIVLYYKNEIDVSSFQATPGWKAEGFWKEEFNTRQQTRPTSTIINGVRYQRANLLQYALFPTKSGELTLSPYEIIIQVRQNSRRRDLFSFGMGTERKEVSSLPVKLDVQPLPALNNATFSGGVGNFTISRSIKPNKAFVGESIEITTTISGEGNIPLIVKPEFTYPETLEKYNPQESSSITRDNRQIAGSKTFTDIVIARNEGTFEIPESRLAYYDPEANRYRITTLPALTLVAERDPDAIVTTANELRLEVQPITGLAQWVTVRHAPLYQKSWVWFLLIFPLLVLGGAFGYKKYSDRMNTDTAFARSQKAKEKALAELKKAHEHDDIKQSYYHLQRALTQFICDKLNLPAAGLSTEKIVSELGQRAGQTTAKDVKVILDKCDTIAYAPNITQSGLETDLAKVEELIKTIGKLV